MFLIFSPVREQDVKGTPGSPVRIVHEALECRHRLADGN